MHAPERPESVQCTMPVGATAAEQSEMLTQRGEAREIFAAVTWMPYLNAIETE